MKERLRLFQNGQVSLDTITSDVDFLISQLEEVSEEWIADLRTSWGVLEEIYAETLERNDPALTAGLKKLVEQATAELIRLVNEIDLRCIRHE